MKNRIYYLILVCMAGYFAACTNMDDTYKEFVVLDGIIYPQKIDSVKVYSGFGRLKLEWPKPVDPKVVKATVYWNNYTSSQNVDFPVDKNTISCIIEGLEEETYTFYIKSFDEEGNVSLPTEVSGRTYGEIFTADLANRSVLSAMVDNDVWTINWSSGTSLSEGAISTEVEYLKKDGSTATVTVPVNESRTIINDVAPGEKYKLRTAYFIEDQYLDVLYSDYSSGIVESVYKEVKIPSDRFVNAKLPTDYYAANGGAANVQLAAAWDGIRSTGFDASRPYVDVFSSLNTPGWPKHFTIGMGRTVIISHFKMYQFARNLYNKSSPHSFELWGSMEPNPDGSFDESWTKLGEYTVVKPSGYDAGAANKIGAVTAEDQIAFFSGGDYRVDPANQIQVKYLRLKIIDTFDIYSNPAAANWLIVDELEFWGGIVEE